MAWRWLLGRPERGRSCKLWATTGLEPSPFNRLAQE
jgi:hypothetical protein